MQNPLLILCEVCYLSGESGLLSRGSASSLSLSSFSCGSLESIDVKLSKKNPEDFSPRTVTSAAARPGPAPGTQAECDCFSGHIPKLIYLLHLASITGSKAQVTALFNTSTKV